MNSIEIQVDMLERLYDLVDTGQIEQFKNYRNYVINVNEEIEGVVEYNVYRKAIDKINLAAVSFDYKKMDEAKEYIEIYKNIAKKLSTGELYYEK